MSVLASILALTDAKPTGPDKWVAHGCCHGSKRHRDLSIRVAENKILLHCFAGCLKPAICSSLRLELKDLFTDVLNPDPRRRREAIRERDRQRQERERHERQPGALIDALREADYFVRSRQGVEISGWSDEKLNNDLDALADAYHLLENEDLHGCLG